MVNTYDFVVIGAGPAGSAFAARLSTLLPSRSILLLEAGAGTAETEQVDKQLLFDRYSAFRQGDARNWGYTTIAQEEMEGRKVDYSRGKGSILFLSPYL